eukprot:sb/3474625/
MFWILPCVILRNMPTKFQVDISNGVDDGSVKHNDDKLELINVRERPNNNNQQVAAPVLPALPKNPSINKNPFLSLLPGQVVNPEEYSDMLNNILNKYENIFLETAASTETPAPTENPSDTPRIDPDTYMNLFLKG